ncbi:MAG TPA: alpha-glucan family phosphorylase, partial [Nitrospiria bacterium]|nr:alpha-glucan family phosphorylase [Nitrospiria bacterium]
VFDADLGPREGILNGRHTNRSIAYFSAEFGLHNSLPIYSGGLGLLSGDHCKEASDLGIPLVGVGFLYPQGYFEQRIQADGWQEAIYRPLDMSMVPLRTARTPSGEPCVVGVEFEGRTVFIAVWELLVGRVKLHLLDTNVERNAPWDRELSARLYGGDQELRIRQEIVLGIGGVRALRALSIDCAVWHANEGHTAFMMLELIREEVERGATFQTAMERVRRGAIFTTHTPVPAGHDAFPFHLMERYFSGYWTRLGLDKGEFMELGRNHEPWGEAFNMTVLALRLAEGKNAVSKVHGVVSRKMWSHLWPETREEEIPITSITNGIHAPTWIAHEMNRFYKKVLGPEWINRHDDPALWERILEASDEELWSVHQLLKRKLLYFMRERARVHWTNDRLEPIQILAAGTLLGPEALTIGFARRVTAYKRATLLFRDLDRLKRILCNRWRPVQIIFAGKAHPADEVGKRFIHQIYTLAKDPALAGHIAFVGNYDMHVSHFFVQGVDVWLNTPRAPLEASGTSGQKAALNGVPHLSILDGWWKEGYNGANGWGFGGERVYASHEAQDAADAEALYQLLEQEVIPLYYKRDPDGVPRGWTQVVKETIRTNAPLFCARRMLKEYAWKLYGPALDRMENGDKEKAG